MDFVWTYIEDDIPEDNETVLLLCNKDIKYEGVGGSLIVGKYRAKTNDYYIMTNYDRAEEIIYKPYEIKMWARIPLPSTDNRPLLRHRQIISDESGGSLHKAVVCIDTWNNKGKGEVSSVDYTLKSDELIVRNYSRFAENVNELSNSVPAFISKVRVLIDNHNKYVQEHPEVVPEILAQVQRARQCIRKVALNHNKLKLIEENTTCA